MIQAFIVVLSLAVLVIGVQAYLVNQAEERIQVLHAERAASKVIHAQATELAIKEQKAIEAKRRELYEQEITKVRIQAENAKRESDKLNAVADSLRQHIIYLATTSHSGTSEDTSASSGSQATSFTPLVLAKLYGGVDLEAIELAQALDASYRAGKACEVIYESLHHE
jgi:hypothetical protein